MNPRWKSVWMTPAACGAVQPLPDRPGPRLLGPGGEVGLQAERVEARPRQLVEAGLLGAEALEHLERLVGDHVHEVHLELGVEEHRVGRAPPRSPSRAELGVGELVLVEVEHVDERLGRQQTQPLASGQVDPGSRPSGIQRPALLEHLLRGERVVEGSGFLTPC